jgi:hypothetical protein
MQQTLRGHEITGGVEKIGKAVHLLVHFANNTHVVMYGIDFQMFTYFDKFQMRYLTNNQLIAYCRQEALPCRRPTRSSLQQAL